MSSELFWLTLTAVYTALLAFPYTYARVMELGLMRALLNPVPGGEPFEKDWVHRAYRSHMNAIENLVVFAPLAIAVDVGGSGNEVTAMASATYFWARLVHAPVNILKIPVVRTLAYGVGVGACLVLAGRLLL